MKLHLSRLTLLLAVLATTQCKKSGTAEGGTNGNSNTYYMRFKLNGNPVEYDSEPFANLSFSSADGLYTAVMGAYKDVNAGSKNSATIIVYSTRAIAANVAYDDPQKAQMTSGGQVPQATVFWYDSAGTGHLTAGELTDGPGTALPGVVADAKLTITELTTTYLKGTFSGTVYRPDFGAHDAVTDGEFYLKRQ